MKNGYDQFFKSAKKIAQNNGGQSSVKMKLNRSLADESALQEALESRISRSKPKSTENEIRQKMGVKSKKKRKISWKMGAFSFLGLMICLYGFIHAEKFEKWLQKIEISYLGSAHANEKSSTEKDKPESQAQGKENKEDKSSEKKTEEKKSLAEGEINHLEKLVERKKQLDDREQELNHIEEELNKQKAEIEARLKSLDETRQKISTTLEERVKVDEQKVDNLMQMYSNMKPPQAAKVFEAMDEDLAVEILGRMKKKNAAEIMNLLKPEKAQLISEKYAGYKRQPASAKTEAEQKKEETKQTQKP